MFLSSQGVPTFSKHLVMFILIYLFHQMRSAIDNDNKQLVYLILYPSENIIVSFFPLTKLLCRDNCVWYAATDNT